MAGGVTRRVVAVEDKVALLWYVEYSVVGLAVLYLFCALRFSARYRRAKARRTGQVI